MQPAIPLLLTVLLAQSVFPTPIKRAIPDRKELVDKLNDARRTIANEHQIANMHKLTYDDVLEKKAEAMAKNCDSVVRGPDYIIIPATNNPDIDKLAALASLFPLQVKVGCAEMEVECIEQGVKLNGICLMGPYSEKTGTADLIKKGPAGSQCPGKQSNGLCVSKFSGIGNGWLSELFE